MTAAGRRAEEVARAGYGRLVALLAARLGDLALAEDALADAFRLALETWPERGIPDRPEAWLMSVARNRGVNVRRSAHVRLGAPTEESAITDLAQAEADEGAIPDERLKLLFVCAHPALDPGLRAPLMLQAVLGLEASVVARLFLVPEAGMAQRLVRGKRKIREARIPFVLPVRADMAARLEAVLEAIYGAQAAGFDEVPAGGEGGRSGDQDLGREALFLARLLAELLPDEPEVLGLAALVTHVQARRRARLSSSGAYVPLDRHDVALWDHGLIAEAESLLRRARRLGPVGRFQIEAAIQSAHAQRRHGGPTDWEAIALLYEGLVRIAPGIGAAVGRAVAIGHAQGPLAGLAALDRVDPAVQRGFQPALAARAHLARLAGLETSAREAFGQAIALTGDGPARAYLRDRLAEHGA